MTQKQRHEISFEHIGDGRSNHSQLRECHQSAIAIYSTLACANDSAGRPSAGSSQRDDNFRGRDAN
jgi:hypothetical protein